MQQTHNAIVACEGTDQFRQAGPVRPARLPGSPCVAGRSVEKHTSMVSARRLAESMSGTKSGMVPREQI